MAASDGHFFLSSGMEGCVNGSSKSWKLVKVYWLARMGQNFDQAKRDNNFWPMPNILKGSVIWQLKNSKHHLKEVSGLCTNGTLIEWAWSAWSSRSICSSEETSSPDWSITSLPGLTPLLFREGKKIKTWSNIEFTKGSSVRLVLPAILGKQRAWREIQNLYMRFVILKVRNLLQCIVRGGQFMIQHVCLDRGIDQPGSINLEFTTCF